MRARCILNRIGTILIALALAAPALDASAASSVLLGLPGDQTWPAKSGDVLVYLDDGGAGASPILWWADHAMPRNAVPGGTDLVAAPSVAGTLVAFRRQGEVRVQNVGSTVEAPFITAAGTGGVALSTTVVAWVEGVAGDSDVAWLPLRALAPVVVRRPGRQHSVAVSEGWVAFIDENDGGAVHLVDTRKVEASAADPLASAESTLAVEPGVKLEGALDVALWGGSGGVAPSVAVLVPGALGADVLIFDSQGARVGEVATPFGKRNLRLDGEWIAYEDVGFGPAQVRLVHWITGREFTPSLVPALASQMLGHLAVTTDEVEVVWAGDGEQGFDVFRYTLALPFDGGEGEPGGPASCASTTAEVLADFAVRPDEADVPVVVDSGAFAGTDRGLDGWHVKDTGAHDEGWHGDRAWRAFATAAFDAVSSRRVLVCIETVDVASAWVGVGSQVVAAPSDFDVGTRSLEARVVVSAGEGRAGAVVIAKKGGTLRVRVLDDPGGTENEPPEGSTCSARGDCPPPPGGVLSKLGCGSSGGAGTLLSLALVAVVAARPTRRRSRA